MADIAEIVASCKREIQALKADKHVTFEQLNFRQFTFTAQNMDAESHYSVTARCHSDTPGRIPVATWSMDHEQLVRKAFPESGTWSFDKGEAVLTIFIGTYASSGVTLDVTVEGFNLSGVSFSLRKRS